ncbi:MAG: RNA polymerase subunit sigma-70 [Actinomycetia bacterium]|nr:RNA polymerase subunit sigma-70 [Actinomycetes bacterium]
MAVHIDELEELRAPLVRFCYRMLGSAADSDDAVQETLIRATTRSDQYDPRRARLTTWVHHIATNVCLDMLRGARRRAVVMDTAPALDGSDIGAPLPADHWVEPMPGATLFGSADPALLVLERETVRLAFIALLQHLPPRQRAVLVLRDVVTLSAQETAEILEMTVPAVNSALQRARATLRSAAPKSGDLEEPANLDHRVLLRRFVRAFESHDVTALTELLRTDATSSMPPFAWRIEGGPRIAALMGASDACAQDRLVPTDVNGQVGFGQYRPADDGELRPFALVAVELRGERIGHIATFLGSGGRFAEFGLPESLGEPN